MYRSAYSQNPNNFSTQQINTEKSECNSFKKGVLTFNQCIRAQKYQFPFIFTLRCDPITNKQGHVQNRIKCTGTLTYKNGRPLDLKKYRFVLMAYQKNLSQFYTIDRQTYNLKFRIILSKNITSQNTQNTYNKQYYQLTQQQYTQIQQKFQQNKQSLSIFLIKLGLVSPRQMSYNRLRNIMLKKMLKNKMNQILQLHNTRYQHQYTNDGDSAGSGSGSGLAIFSNVNVSQIDKQYGCINSSKSYISTNITHTTHTAHNTKCKQNKIINTSGCINKQNRKCCQQQHPSYKQNYPKISILNSPIIPVESIEIKNCVESDQQNLGGYFSVRNYDTVVEVVTQQGTIDDDDGNICDQRQQKVDKQVRKYKNTYKCNTKLAIKHLRKQLQTNPKYLKKLNHQLNIISKIRNNQYMPRYYKLQNQDIHHAQQQKQSKSAIQAQLYPQMQMDMDMDVQMDVQVDVQICLNKQHSMPPQNNNDDHMIQQNSIRQQQQQNRYNNNSDANTKQNKNRLLTNSIFMQSLPISLKQILAKDIFCNHYQIIKQLIKALHTLHMSGIVHRDVKPGNIMFNNRGELKLIDFSQSIQCWRKLDNNPALNANVGFTLPYSPIECSRVCPQGYSNIKIDNWSVGMTICQILNGQLPVSYCKSMSSSIKSGWVTEQFHWCMNLRANTMYDMMILPIKILCLKLLQFKPEDRLCLSAFMSMLQFYEKYILQLC